MTFEKKPLIPLDSESLDGRTVKSLSVNLERGPLPIYSEDRRLVGKITDVMFENNTVYVTGVLDADASAALGLPGSGLAAEIMLDNGDLRGAAVSTDPAFNFEENK